MEIITERVNAVIEMMESHNEHVEAKDGICWICDSIIKLQDSKLQDGIIGLATVALPQAMAKGGPDAYYRYLAYCMYMFFLLGVQYAENTWMDHMVEGKGTPQYHAPDTMMPNPASDDGADRIPTSSPEPMPNLEAPWQQP